MKKYMSVGGVLFLSVFAFSQGQESQVNAFEVHSKGSQVFSVLALKKFALPLPERAIISESYNGTRLFSVSVHGSKLNGNWQSWYATGVLCDSGRLINNLPDGEWKHWNEKGELLAIRHYSADKFQRVMQEMLRYNPKRSFFYLSELYQKDKQAALNYLTAAYSFPSGRSAPVHSLKQLVISNISKSDSYRPVFEQSLQDGLYMNFFPGGSIRDSGYYKNGVRTGKWVHRDSADGPWHLGAYQHSIKIKEWKYYDKNNKLLELIVYDNRGHINWRKKINRQGNHEQH
ncbi:MAG TPA: hypothetical protein PLO70_02855 [Chitinophagaceae bacterium]|nr:hypothetical protein [Chitinophagaceae bacterium]HQV84371.1 hypothetical protein [Chitinophagaceae bacterium]HQX71246.1 hypothetical protein [Chitinophagaceae bacterium]HQZ73421.1 hypothetical protein [Chitinophagaceae bacterium]